MIVSSMSNYEIFSEIWSDYDKVGIRLNSIKDKAIKKFKKEGKRQNFFLEEYIHQATRNKYVVGYCVTLNNFGEPKKVCFCVVEDGGQKYVISLSHSPVKPKGMDHLVLAKGISIYWPHFWQRYRERENIGNDKSFYELVALFMDINSRNNSTFPIELKEEISRHYKKYGDYSGYAMVCDQGLCMMDAGWEGDISTVAAPDNKVVNRVVFKTYLSYRMLQPNQQTALKEEIRKQLEKGNRDIMQHNAYVDMVG